MEQFWIPKVLRIYRSRSRGAPSRHTSAFWPAGTYERTRRKDWMFFSVHLTGHDIHRVNVTSIAEMLSESEVMALSDTRMLRNYKQVKFTQVAVDVR